MQAVNDTNIGTYYKLEKGKLTTHPMHAGKPVSIPEKFDHKEGNHFPLRLTPATPDEDWAWSMAEVRKIATRIAPFSTWFFVPDWMDRGWTNGVCGPEISLAVLRTGMEPDAALAAAYHEAWHLCEEHMSEIWISCVDDCLADGPRWPGSRGEYLNKPKERRAWAFEEFAMMLHRGMVPNLDSSPAGIQVFGRVFSGEVGKLISEDRTPKKKFLGLF